MAINVHATGLTALRIFLGLFFIFAGVNKVMWLLDGGILAAQLQDWLASAHSSSRWYLETVAIPGARFLARLVVLGELALGSGLLLGVWVRTAAVLGFLMVVNFHFASGRMFHYAFLTDGYGLPVLGGLLALAIGGSRLPGSLKRG